MGNASNQPTGYFEYIDENGGTKWKISWQVIQNMSNFTWTITVKYYLNSGGSSFGYTFKPKIQIGPEIYEGVLGTYGYSNDYVKLMEASRTYSDTQTGRQATAIYGYYENSSGDSWTMVRGAVTFASFSGAQIKINNQWEVSMPWIKVNGQWKQCKQYIKQNGEWKLSNQVWLWDPF